MRFGDTPLAEAKGAILAHAVRAGKVSFKKGRVLSAEDVSALRQAGIATVIAARLEPGDIGEDDAARRIAEAAAGDNLDIRAAFTGRCNLYAAARGLLVADRDRIDRLNLIDEAVTLATLAPYDRVEPGDLAATVKIIPFAIPEPVLHRCLEVLAEDAPALRVAALRPRPIALIQTVLPGLKASVLDKTVEATRARASALASPLTGDTRCPHEPDALAHAIDAARAGGAAVVLVSGASAITDRRDVIPAAIERAGGRIEHFGMPVDPGNLILVGRIGEIPVLGLPGCARSPKFNGFDWVLERLLCDIPVTSRDIMRMGAGGLLTEIPSRPQPRAGDQPVAPSRGPRRPRIGALVLAAGRSSRMGSNKLLASLDGKPLLLAAVDATLGSQARPVIVVTGHEDARVREVLGSRTVVTVHNPEHAEGLSTSLKQGLAALPADIDGVLVCLADMPRVTAATIDRLIAAFDPVEGRTICVPTWEGKRGNPVLWGRQFFAEMMGAAGDTGAKHLIGEHAEAVAEVAMADDGVLVDVDTPEVLAALASSPHRQA